MIKSRIGIFGYGSLMSIDSAQKVLKRKLKLSDLVPAILQNYSRAWNLKETVFFEAINSIATGVFLNIQPDLASSLNGLIINISEDELNSLRIREKNYDCVDITLQVENHEGYTQIYTFIAKKEFILTVQDVNVFIPKKYTAMVENACSMISNDFLNVYRQTTFKSAVPLIDGNYSFVDPQQAELT